jgi:ubiquitin-protein ligase
MVGGTVDINRIQREFVEAQGVFARVELQPTSDGKVYARTALQTVNQTTYVLSIRFPDSYPNEMPRVTVDAPAIATAPHRYQNGMICYLHPSMWNPGVHNLSFVIARSAKWLNKYEIWKSRGKWPGAEIKH